MSDSALQIRPATEHDLDAMVALLAQLFRIENDFTVDASKQRRGLQLLLQAQASIDHNNVPRAHLIVAQLGKKIVGMCSCQVTISTAEGNYSGWVEDVIIDQQHRQQGVGKAMMEYLNQWARQHGISRLQLLADSENQPALNFYQKQDWQISQMQALRKYLY